MDWMPLLVFFVALFTFNCARELGKIRDILLDLKEGFDPHRFNESREADAV